MNLATLCHNEGTNTWSAEFAGHMLVKSVGGESSKQYVIDRINNGRCAKAIKLNVTGFTNIGGAVNLAPSPISEAMAHVYVPAVKANNRLTVEQRYILLDECIEIALLAPGIRSLIITGDGSLGKTFHTKKKIKQHGLLSTEEAITAAHTLSPEEQIVADKILERMNECREQVFAYYEKHGLPELKKKKKNKDDDEDEGVEEEDKEEDEPEFSLVFGEVNFTKLHTSLDILDRCVGGRFHHPSGTYDYNIKLAVKNPEEYYNQIVPHEVAHHVQFLLFPNSMKKDGGHGRQWKKIMTDVFGLKPDEFHLMDTTDVRVAPDLVGDYHYVKGYSSAKGLYRLLYENKKKIVIFDDCDAAWKNAVSANLLKAALDSDEERWVTWNVEGSANDDLPTSFLFEGKVIFISNVKSEDFPQPLITRALRCDVELTIDERFERMRQILPNDDFAPGISIEIRQMAFDFLWDNRNMAAEISSRSLLNICKVADTGSKYWREIALSNIQ